MTIFELALVFVITFLFSFGVQFGFYLWYKKHHERFLTKNQYVLQYWSGILGDGVFVPLINVFAVLTLYQIGIPEITTRILIVSLTSGFLITWAFHFGQEYFKLTNWTMPKVGEWNNLGLYHAIFMFFESSFLVFTLVSFLDYTYFNGPSIIYNSPIKYGFLVLFIFACSFVHDYWYTLFKNLVYREKKLEKILDFIFK